MKIFHHRFNFIFTCLFSAVCFLQTTYAENNIELVKNINPSSSSFPNHLTKVGHTLFFTADPGLAGDGRELWKSNGTESGTSLVKDIWFGLSHSSTPRNLIDVNGELFFTATDGVTGRDLWKSNGTESGTIKVKNLPATPSRLTNVNGTVFFTVFSNTSNYTLWKSYGTDASTVMIKDLGAGAHSNYKELTAVNNTLFFVATDGVHGYELWKSDGTSTGTVMVKDIVALSGSSNPKNLTNLNGILYFTTYNKVWRSNGTDAGTFVVSPIFSSPSSFSLEEVAPISINNTVFFRGTRWNADNTADKGLWKTDGTLVVGISSGSGSTNIDGYTVVQNTIYFVITKAQGKELWKTNGTTAGTFLVKDFSIHPGTPTLKIFTDVDGTLFFRTKYSNGISELWKSNGTEAGTTKITGDAEQYIIGSSLIKVINGVYYFVGEDSAYGVELRKFVNSSAPLAASLIAPTGTITNNTPSYTWNAVSNATYYYLWVSDSSSTNKIKKWYSAAQAGCGNGTGTCTITPTTTLANGVGKFWIKTWNNTGNGPWSSANNFTVSASTVPAKATLISPSGNISDNTPTYTWNAVSNATYYYLWVSDSISTNKIKKWYSAAQAGCSNGTGTCSITRPTILANGAGKFWIKTWNTTGNGQWSSTKNFTVSSAAKPPAATLILPSGDTHDFTPTYTWNAVSNSTWYYLWVADSGSGSKIKKWYSAAQAGCSSGSGTCSITPATGLTSGAGQWWIQTWNSAGKGPWSLAKNFNIQGFNFQ